MNTNSNKMENQNNICEKNDNINKTFGTFCENHDNISEKQKNNYELIKLSFAKKEESASTKQENSRMEIELQSNLEHKIKNLIMLPKNNLGTFDNFYNILCKYININNHIHINFKNLCDSLSDNTKLNKDIKNIIMCCIKNGPEQISIELLYLSVKINIMQQNLNDFEIISPTGEIFRCNKEIFITIPYFKNFIQDITLDCNSLKLDENYELTKILIQLVCDLGSIMDDRNNYIKIFLPNYVEIFLLMDYYGMSDYFWIMLSNKNSIIEELIIDELIIRQKNFNKINKLYNLLKMIANNTNNEYFESVFGIKYKASFYAKMMLDQIKKFLNQINIIDIVLTDFDDWQNIFNVPNKLILIHKSNNYELLNIVNIKPKFIIEFLALINQSNYEYYDIFNIIESHNYSKTIPNLIGNFEIQNEEDRNKKIKKLNKMFVGYEDEMKTINTKRDEILEPLKKLSQYSANSKKSTDSVKIVKNDIKINILKTVKIVFDPHNIEYKKYNGSIIVINSYYPKLIYTKIIELSISVINKKENCVTIKLLKNNVIKIGDNILFGNDLTLKNLDYKYNVKSIIKLFGQTCENVTEAKYTPINFKMYSVYNLFLDRVYDMENYNRIYLIEYCEV